MGKGEVETLALQKPFSLFVQFSQEIMVGAGGTPFWQNLLDTPDLHSRKPASGRFGASTVVASAATWNQAPQALKVAPLKRRLSFMSRGDAPFLEWPRRAPYNGAVMTRSAREPAHL
jgi:hypothetical protein